MKLNIEEYVGRTFGDLTVIEQDSHYTHGNSNRWIFLCKCGNTVSALPSRVISGHRKSCGCQKGRSAYIHGCNGDEFYPTWWGMMRRCYNEEAHNYKRYGGRGITVCDEWHDPAAFILWARATAGNKSNALTLDRIDNNKSYSPENCRWVSAKKQANNRRSNSLETMNGETKTLAEWCAMYNIKSETVRARQKRGLSFEQALTLPVQDTRYKSKWPVFVK